MQLSFADDLTAFLRDSATGDLLITATMLNGWLADGARDVIRVTPVQKLWASSAETSLTNATGSTITTRKILGVTRSDGDFEHPCREVHFLMEGRVSNPEDTQFAIKQDPVYFLKDQLLKVKPDPTSTASAKIHTPTYPTPTSASTSIGGFEDDAELLVRQYMKIQAKYREMGQGRRKSQDEIEVITTLGIIAEIDTLIGSATAALGKVDGLINSATAFSASAIAELGALFGQTTSGSFGRFVTAIADVQTDMDSAVSVLGSTSPGTNAVNALLVASATTSPADQDAINFISTDDLEKANAVINLARGRIEEAANIVNAGSGKISEAQAELENIKAHVQPINAYYTGSEAKLKEAAGYIGQSNGYLGAAQTFLAESGIHIQTAGIYLKHSEQSKGEADVLQQKYEKDRTEYARG